MYVNQFTNEVKSNVYQTPIESDVLYRCDEHHTVEKYMPSTFGQRLTQLREERQPVITQGQFASALTKWMQQWLEKNNRPRGDKKYTFSQQQVSKWEAGGEPANEVIVAVASFFGVSPLYMAGISDERELQDTATRDISDEEWEILIQIRSNEILNVMVHQLLDVVRSQGLLPAQKSKKQSRIASTSKTQ